MKARWYTLQGDQDERAHVADAAHRTAPPGVRRRSKEAAVFFAALYETGRRRDRVSDLDIMAELAGFAATFAQMTRDPLGVAQAVARLAVQVPENGAGEQPEQPPV